MKNPNPIIIAKNDTNSLQSNEITPSLDTYATIGNRQFWIDGSLIVSGTAITDTTELRGVLPRDIEFWNIKQIAFWWSHATRNVGALFVRDLKENWSACLPDPLGGAIVFYASCKSINVASTKIEAIVNTIQAENFVMEKDPLFQAERILFGNGGLVNSSYRNIKSIEPFEYIVINSGILEVFKYSIFDDFAQLTNDELFHILRSDVLGSVNAVLNSSSSQKISHLTGGFDSRLVLSAISKLGRTSEVSFFCSGPEGTTDRVIADGLTRSLNLRRTDGAGLTPSKTNLMSERLLAPLFASSGITSSGPLGRELSVSVSAMGGGYGEILRTFYGERPISKNGSDLDKKIINKSFFPSLESQDLSISTDAVTDLQNLLFDKFQRLFNQYANLDFIGDAHYTHGRNRYHIGQNSLLWSRIGARFDPLYSVAGYVLASKIPQFGRFSNVLGFDLMESLNQELLRLPFDYDRFNENLLSIRRRPSSLNMPKADTVITFEKSLWPDSNSTSSFLNILKSLKSSSLQLTPQKRQETIKQANKLGVNYWQLANKENGQEILKLAYDNISDDSIFEFFNKEYIVGLFTKDSLKRQELRDLYNIGGAITWLSFG